MQNKISLKNFHIGQGEPLTIISGPCVMESEDHTLMCAEKLKKIFNRRGVNFIFKSSYDKANRSAGASFRGPGLQEGLRILEKVKETLDLPILTDVHLPQDAATVAEVCDLLQVPAFLCRQTDLIMAIAATGRIVNIKKGQFMAPWDMKNAVEKVYATGNRQVILTDRGTCFGYNNLVSDMRAIPIMQGFGVPVCFDATHSVQLPGGQGDSSGGQREFVPILAQAAVAAGANCIFMESHPEPSKAKSDGPVVVDFKDLPNLLTLLERIHELVK